VVRVCQPTYSKVLLEAREISVYDWYFADGKAPPHDIIQQWRKLVRRVFYSTSDEEQGIAIHCVAGLGRAPLMVAVALINEGLDRVEAIKRIRDQVSGSFNHQQIDFLMSYSPSKKMCLIQ
jgi:protein tyrosine phosphatase type 4A